MSIIANHQAAAEVLAAAVLDLFPDTLLLGGRGTSRCFFYDFRFSFAINVEVLRRIEERMQQILRSEVTLVKREMVAANAAEVFKSKGQLFLTHKMKGLQKNVVSFCAIGEHFLDYVPFTFSKGSLPQIKLMKIQELNLLEGKSVRLVGGFLEDKKELKELTSTLKSAVDEKLFLPLGAGEWVWLSQAESVKELLIDKWRKAVRKQGFELISTPSIDEPSLLRAHHACFLKRNCKAVAEITTLPTKDYTDPRNGLLEPAKAFTDRLSLSFTHEDFLDSCISCLLFILESPKILGFEFHLFFGSSIAKQAKGYAKEGQQMRAALDKLELEYSVEKQYRSDYAFWIEVRFSDRLGRLWSGPFVALPFALSGVMVCSALGAMERTFGLAIERHGENVCEFIKREVGSEPEN
jgi:threonyl-tRNA synthetase